MSKKIILTIILLILTVFAGIIFLGHDSVDIYIDGENITVETKSLSTVNKKHLNKDITNYTLEVMNDTAMGLSIC